MLFDLSRAYRHFDNDVRFAELTEDDAELNDAYEFTKKNSPTSAAIQNLINTAVKMLEKGKGTRGESLFRGDRQGKKNLMSRLLWEGFKVAIDISANPHWSMPLNEVVKKVKFNRQWWDKVIELYFVEINKRKKELGK